MVAPRTKRKITHRNDKSHLNKKTNKQKDGLPSLPSTSSSVGDPINVKKAKQRSRASSVMSTSTDSSIRSQREGLTSKSANAAKPVFVDASYKTLNNVLINVVFPSKTKPMMKVMSPIKTQVCCSTVADKEVLIEKLKSQSFKFFTFSEPSSKPLIYVLKGFPKEQCVDINKLLLEMELPTVKVTFLVDSDYPVYLVHFTRQQDPTKNVNLQLLQITAKHVGNVIVKWERFDRSRKRMTQCFKCQLFGHTASNCGRDYKCVKCTEMHLPGECKRKSKDQEGSPKCVNCQGDHTANSHTCPHFQTYAEKVKRQRNRRKEISQHFYNAQQAQRPKSRAPTVSNHQRVPAATNENFPPLNKTGNVSTRNEIELQTYANFSSLQSRFNAIPGIAQSLKKFEAFVSKLESARSEGERQFILLDFYTANQNAN